MFSFDARDDTQKIFDLDEKSFNGYLIGIFTQDEMTEDDAALAHEFRDFILHQDDPKIGEALNENCKKEYDKFGLKEDVPFDIETVKVKIPNYIQLYIALVFYVAGSEEKSLMNVPAESALAISSRLGFLLAMRMEAQNVIASINKTIAELPFEEKNLETIQKEIDRGITKCLFICDDLLPTHWKAGFAFAACYRTLLARLLNLAITEYKKVSQDSSLDTNTLDKISSEVQSLQNRVEILYASALRDMQVASFLGENEILREALPEADNLSIKEFNENFDMEELLEDNVLTNKYSELAKDPFNGFISALSLKVTKNPRVEAKAVIDDILKKKTGQTVPIAPLVEKIKKNLKLKDAKLSTSLFKPKL